MDALVARHRLSHNAGTSESPMRLVEARHEPAPRDGARGRGGLAAVVPVGRARRWNRVVLYVQVARLVHVTYWVPAGRAMDATAGTLRVGAVDATAGGPSFLLKNATGVHPFTLLMEEVGRGQDAGRAGWHRRCRPTRSSHRVTACSSPQGRTHRVGYTTQKTKARVEEKARERRSSRAGDGSRP